MSATPAPSSRLRRDGPLGWMVRALAVWVGMLVLAVANGYFRQVVLVPQVGPHVGHVLSTLLLCSLVFGFCWVTLPWLAPASRGAAVAIGTLWVLLTVAFELGFGRLVAHRTWGELLADYDVAAGRVWLLVLLTTFAAPAVARRLRAG